jgi:hypothetical protein
MALNLQTVAPLPQAVTLDGLRKLSCDLAAREELLRQVVRSFEQKYPVGLDDLLTRLKARQIAEHPTREDSIEWGNALDQIKQARPNQSIVTWLIRSVTP